MSVKLSRCVGRGLTNGEPLPDVLTSFKEHGIRFYRGGTVLIGGTPGSMKTMLVGHLVDVMQVPTLYLSNDTNELDIASRFLSRRTRLDSRLMRERALKDPAWAARTLSDMEWVRWSFSPAPALEEIEEEIAAFEELWGEYPHLVVVDILMKVDYFEEGRTNQLEPVVQFLDKVARETQACVVIVCHTSENEPGYPTQPLRAFLEKIGKLPTMALTTAYSDGILYVAPVKNRNGWADSSGKNYLTFLVDAPTAMIEELE